MTEQEFLDGWYVHAKWLVIERHWPDAIWAWIVDCP